MTVAPLLQVGSGTDAGRIAEVVDALVDDRVASRLFARDASLWGPEVQADARDRLGWVDAWSRSEAIIEEAERVRAALHATGVERIVLCGMGGSSLAPEVIARHARVSLIVLDSTHPDDVRRTVVDLTRTAVVVSSKSGSTVETRSHLSAFEAAFLEVGIDPAERVVVVTDPGSALDEYAAERGYRRFAGEPDVGGRFSAYTAFGLVPPILAGADARPLLADARDAATVLGADDDRNPGLVLAALLADALPERYLARTSERGDRPSGIADWIEQLVAESTGKRGRGMLPIAVPAEAADRIAQPSNTIDIEIELHRAVAAPVASPHRLSVAGPLGAQFLLWEVATAALGRLIGVNPFDQPDVEAAKEAARARLSAPHASGSSADGSRHSSSELLDMLRASIPENGYLAIQAFTDRSHQHALERLRAGLAHQLGVPVALGFGPRYLHSTGQFHKGGPALGVFLQVTDDGTNGEGSFHGTDFAALIDAQAHGDRTVLEGADRPVLRISSTDIEPLARDLAG